MKNFRLIAILALIVLMICGCRRQPDATLMHLYELTDTDPHQALTALDSIDRMALSATDRDFYDLVRLKASDKAYISHTTDSTILRLLDCYEGDGRFGPEVVYYAGRVYSDLGDYPTAIKYFQSALDLAPVEENPKLRGQIASQTGRLLNSLSIWSGAVPYLKESLRIDSILRDTVNLMYDHQLLGSIYTSLNHLDSADNVLNKGKEWAGMISENAIAEIDLYLAYSSFLKNDTASALNLIRGVPEKIEPRFRNLSLLYSTEIYLAAGKLDTAYHYVNQLIHSSYIKNQRPGLSILLNSPLRNFIPADSILSYQNKYNCLLEKYSSSSDAEEVIYQNSHYNYECHEKKRIEAERKRDQSLIWTFGFMTALFVALCIGLFFFVCYQRNYIKLQQAHVDILTLKQMMVDDKIESSLHTHRCVRDIKDRLKNELMALKDSGVKGEINPAIFDSDAFKEIRTLIDTATPLKADSPIWDDLAAVIESAHPGFRNKVELLVGGPLSLEEYRTVMLLKCGFKPVDLSILFSRGKAAITLRRKALSEKFLGAELSADTIDDIIRLL